MKPKHTPGPWLLKQATKSNKIVDSKDNLIAECAGWGVAFVSPDEISPYRQFKENSNLIAAAPDLFEACQTFELWLSREEHGLPPEINRDGTPEGERQWRIWFDENLRLCDLATRQARAAIAKANGTTL